MIRQAYRYRFKDEADRREAEDTLMLALLAAEGLFGRCRLVMDADFAIDEFIDVHDPLLYYMVAAWSEDFSGQIVEYGTLPQQNRAFFTRNDAS